MARRTEQRPGTGSANRPAEEQQRGMVSAPLQSVISIVLTPIETPDPIILTNRASAADL